ncbi:MAG TPA: FtsX-like permease family protein [Verrucomicrobiae bacterium]|nr:FtsX-like permease family protein [Verrucomicrobiae bacterium]
MNLAARDIRHNLARFGLTACGIGLLLMIVLGMGGIYHGLVYEATLLVDRVNADLWVVQRNTRGPFAEISSVPASVENRLLAVPGVANSRRFVYWTIQREASGRPLRLAIQGLVWPDDTGAWLPLVVGRPLGQAHYEIVADLSLGLRLGQQIKLGKDFYSVVGLTKGMTSASGDGMAFFTLPDAQAIQFDQPGEAIRLQRNTRVQQLLGQDLGQQQPGLLTRVSGLTANLPAILPPTVSAVLVRLAPGADSQAVINTIQGWPDLTVYTQKQQQDLLVHGFVDRSRRQLGLFRAILVVVSTIIMTLILYTLTLDKTHDIAMLKLMGARNRLVVGLIVQQALLLGALGYGLATLLGHWLFPLFPRLVVITPPDLWVLAAATTGIAVAASLLGIWKALRISPNTVLS